MHTVCGTPLHGGCDALQPGRMEELEREHVRNGRSFDRWKEVCFCLLDFCCLFARKGFCFADISLSLTQDAFLALVMYYQLLLGFGWPAYLQVFKTYVTAGLRPANDSQKRDTWLVQFSTQVKRNLG